MKGHRANHEGGGHSHSLMAAMRDEDCSLVADRELVVARRHGAVPFEAIDAALDRMTLVVVGRVAARRLAAAGAGPLAVACFCGQG